MPCGCNKEVGRTCNSCNDHKAKVQVMCCEKPCPEPTCKSQECTKECCTQTCKSQDCCTSNKTLFDINCDFCKLRQHKGACIKKCTEGCSVVYKLSVAKTCRGGCVNSPGVVVSLETRARTCYKIELEGKDICGVPAFVLVQDSHGNDLIPRDNTKICVKAPFNFCLPFTAVTSKTLVGVNFWNDCSNSELEIFKFRVVEVCAPSCNQTCTSNCCPETCDKPCETKCESNKTPCTPSPNKPNVCDGCQKFPKDCTCSGPDKCLLKICENSNCNFKLSTTAVILWNNVSLSGIEINGKPLNLYKIGNHDGLFTLDDVVNHNGDKQLAALIAKTLRLPRCEVKVKTIIVINPTQNIQTTIQCLPVETVVTAQSTAVTQPVVTLKNVNTATRYNTAQILPFLGVDVEGVYTENPANPISFSFLNAHTMPELATVIRDAAAGAIGPIFSCNCGNDCAPGTLFSNNPAILIIGGTQLVSTKLVPNPLLQAQSCFDKIFGCSFTTMRDTL